MSNVFLHLVTQEGTSAMLLLANQVPCSQVRNILFCFITTLLVYQEAHKVNFFLQDWNISFNTEKTVIVLLALGVSQCKWQTADCNQG